MKSMSMIMTRIKAAILIQLVLHLSVLSSVSAVAADTFSCSPNFRSTSNCSCIAERKEVVCQSANWSTGAIPADFPSTLALLKVSGGNFTALSRAVGYTQLQQLHVIKVALRRINPGVFVQLALLQTLVLADNNIRVLEPGTFDGLVALQLLDVAGNPLYWIDVGVLSALPSLTTLDLGRCRLNDVEPEALGRGLEKLSELNLAENRLESLPVVDVGSRMSKLNASWNRIRSLDGAVIPSSLEHLDLTGNDVDRLTSATVGSFRCDAGTTTGCQLRLLTLRHNRMSEIGVGSLSTLPHLERLDLSFNDLRSVSADALPWSTLVEVLIHDNPWNCSDCANSWLVEQPDKVGSFNAHAQVLCASPASLAGKNIYTSAELFSDCLSPRPTNVRKVALYVVIPLLLLLAAVSAFGLVVRCGRQRRRSRRGVALRPRYWRTGSAKDGHGSMNAAVGDLADGVGDSVPYRQMVDLQPTTRSNGQPMDF